MSQSLNKAKVDSFSSFLSRPVLLHDLPEVSNVKTEFIYNYFKSDERSVEKQTGGQQGSSVGSYSLAGSLGNQETITANASNVTNSDLYKFYGRNAIVSRFAKITFTPPNVEKETLNTALRSGLRRNEIARENTSNVFSRYAIEITDTAADSSFYTTMQAASNVASTQIANPSNINPDDTYNNSILNSLNSVIQAEGYNFVDDKTAIENPSVAALKGIQNGFSFLPQVAQDIVEGSLDSMKNVYMDELQFLINSSKRAQTSTAGKNPYEIRLSDFDSELNAYTKTDFNNRRSTYQLKNRLVGYIVQKFSINEDGTVKIYPESFIDSPNNTTFLDPDIAYGKRYRYRVLCLYLSDFIAVELLNGREIPKLIGSLFASNGTDALLDCIDQVAPPPPVDLKFRYRADNTGLTITWNFPLNLQNDIVKFQVLRRRSVSEPFELIKEYDFDSSIEPTYSPESAPVSLIQRSIFPVTMHRDTEFTKDSKFIYAVVAVDAHGLTSNYSVQLEASYDRYRNKINTRLISQSDAPKPYPNIFINNDTFVDTMRMSGYTKMSVYFDPEYVKVSQLDSSGNAVDLEHILYCDQSDNNVYKMMVTNTDFQESRVLDIKINNKYQTVPTINVSTARVFDPS